MNPSAAILSVTHATDRQLFTVLISAPNDELRLLLLVYVFHRPSRLSHLSRSLSPGLTGSLSVPSARIPLCA